MKRDEALAMLAPTTLKSFDGAGSSKVAALRLMMRVANAPMRDSELEKRR